MVAIQDNPFDADLLQSRPGQETYGGLRHIADVLGELFERFPLTTQAVEREELEEPAAA